MLKTVFAAQSGQISFGGNLYQVEVIGQLHVLGVNPQDFHPAHGVWDSDIDLSIESSESLESWVDGFGSVIRRHHNDVGSLFEAVHKSQELRDNSSLDLSVWRDGIEFIDKYDCSSSQPPRTLSSGLTWILQRAWT